MTDSTSILKEIVESSATLTTWALSVAGGSVAIIIGTSHMRPPKLRQRLIYLLFVPAWLALAYSLYSGNVVVRKYLAALSSAEQFKQSIESGINDVYDAQLTYLFISLAIFGVWLVSYALCWICDDKFLGKHHVN